MNAAQRKRYILEARKAFECAGVTAGRFDDWRHAQVEYVLGCERPFSSFGEMELTQCLIHFRELQSGRRLAPNEILRLAEARQAEGRLAPFRRLWDAIEPGVRMKVMRQRHALFMFEELAHVEDEELLKIRFTLTRLARDYPAAKEAHVLCSTS